MQEVMSMLYEFLNAKMKHTQVKHECASTTVNKKRLIQLVRSKNLRIIRQMLKDVDINMTYENDETLLTIAAKYCRNLNIIKELIKYGANINVQNKVGDTSLILAIKSGEKPDVVKTLLEHGANFHATNKAGDTALSLAVKYKRSIEVIKNLLEYGSNAHNIHYAVTTLLIDVIRHDGRLKVLKEFLKHGADVNAADEQNDKPLVVAIKFRKSIKVIKELLKFGAEVNVTGNASYTPLIQALIFNGDAEIIKELLQWGADASCVHDIWATPLHVALEVGRDLKIIKMLLLHGADTNAISNRGRTPLNIALKFCNNIEIFKELLSYGANANVVDNEGCTPLNCAIIHNKSLAIILMLLEHGADPNLANRTGEMPLYMALRRYKSMEVIETLVNHGACIKSGAMKGFGLLNNVYTNTCAKFLIKYALLENFDGDYVGIINVDYYKQSWRYAELSCYFEKCFQEILKMKATQINGVSLYKILTIKNINVALFPDNKNVMNVVVRLMADYPIYHDVISPRIKHAVKRGTLLKQLSNVGVYTKVLASEATAEDEIIGLPSESTAVIAKFLSNDDLHNLILAFYIPNQSGDEVVKTSPSSATNFKRQLGQQIAGDTLGNCSKIARLE